MVRLLKWGYGILAVGLLSLACQPEVPTSLPPVPLNRNLRVVQDEFQGLPLVIAGSQAQNFLVAYERTLADGTLLQLETVQQRTLPAILQDNEGNVWDLFGTAIEGPRRGEQLQPVNAYMGYWFAFGANFPGAEIYLDHQPVPTFTNAAGSNGWLIPSEEVYAGAGRDGIPSLEMPRIDTYTERNNLGSTDPFYLDDNELVIGIRIGDRYRLYPHLILNWHEIVNDTLGEHAFSLIYSPLTGTGTAWNRKINGFETTFGVSGMVFNNNIIPYDRISNSNWSQMRGDCVQGRWRETEAMHYPVIETTWKTWRSMFKSVPILSPETLFARDYAEYPFVDYASNNEYLLFPLTFDDPRLPRKERVLGVVINGAAKVYRLGDF